ncbi:MAG: cysteine desulfurase [Actinobacteria bacterium]|nr:cysteine desulfurase [Actinomycetota bacterium]MBU1609134.1 cysteine desulfurase [Actinomycetota bacterium]MBU2314736.1 cysteine desulfurase [Actinomycetota bacterium]MBU2384393.1 cysteine desulfurase [Actinomycetota bacterium]
MTIYLDHAATSPMPRAVRERYVEALDVVGNPSSIHSSGQSARALLDESRTRIAATLGVDPIEVTFTGGGTEAVNLAVKGMLWSRRAAGHGSRILAPAAEHHATLDAVQWLVDHEGATVDWLPVDASGRLRLDALESAFARGPAALLTMLAANNEVGTLQPVAEAAALAAAAGVPVHVDAIAAYGQVPLAPLPAGVSAVSISAHKVGGPVGVGALVLRRGTEVEPLLHGGGQQRGRSGTMDAAGAAAFAHAAELAHAELAERAARKRELRDRLAEGIRNRVPEARLSTDLTDSLPGTLHLRVPGAEGDSLLFLLDQAGFAVSTGSACQAGVPEPSHVLLAMGVPASEARGSLRVSLGPSTTAAEIDALLDALPHAARQALAAGLAGRQPRLGRSPHHPGSPRTLEG